MDDPRVREIANSEGAGQTVRMHRLVSQAQSGNSALFMRAANVLASFCDSVQM